MKTTKNFQTLAQVCDFIETMANAYSVVFENDLIKLDGKTSAQHLREVHDDHLACDGKARPTFYYAPYEFWIGIRTRGVESAVNKHDVVKRVMDMGDKTLCAIRVEYTHNDEFIVTFKRRELAA